MAIRVDNIIVTDKNVLLLSDEGHQLIADIEKNTDALDSGNFTRERNPWNFYSSDGVIYHNLFDTSSFDIRTQTLTGSNRYSPNNSRSHETIFMPSNVEYAGNCQFYGNSYTLTKFTTASVSSNVSTVDGVETISCDHGFVRYDSPTAYENPSEYYISPKTKFNPLYGVQYLSEYPLNGYYMDFGDNETEGRPTVFGDSVLTKYYLDQGYSVSSYDINDNTTRFRQLRTYYDVGSTGNSIYMVFRNDLNGVSRLDDSEYVVGGTLISWKMDDIVVYVKNGDDYVTVDKNSISPNVLEQYYIYDDGNRVEVDISEITTIEWSDCDVYEKNGDSYEKVDKTKSPEYDVTYYVLRKISTDGSFWNFDSVGYFPVSSIGYMSNMVTFLDTNESHETSGFFYSSSPYSDMFRYHQMDSVSSNLERILHPSDNSFILFSQNTSNGETKSTKFTYVPKIGLERSSYEMTLGEDFDKMSIVELPHCVAIGTASHGILTVWSRDYLYDGGNTLVDFNPFQYACLGLPSNESLSAKIDGNMYKDIRLFYNGSDILAAKTTVSNELSSYVDDEGRVFKGAQVAFFSTSHEGDGRKYEIGQFFLPAGNPLYEIEEFSVKTPIVTQTLSSVPVSSINASTGSVTWNFEMRSIDVITGFETTTTKDFQVSANYVYDSDILFDYSSTEVENEIKIGSYAFVQFEKYGLAKCHVDDIYSTDGMVKFSSTGPVNRYDSRKRRWNLIDYPNSVDYPNGVSVDWRVRSKANTFSDLKAYDPTAFGEDSLAHGDILSLVEPHFEAMSSYGVFSYYAYFSDGNTSSWYATSLPYIKGNLYDTDFIYEVEAKNGYTYFLTNETDYTHYQNTSSEEFSALPEYSFYQYNVNGNLSSWDNVNESLMISGSVENYDDLPGASSYYTDDIAVKPELGKICLVRNSTHLDQTFYSDKYSFYVYDIYGLRWKDANKSGKCITYSKGWTYLEDASKYIHSMIDGANYNGTFTIDFMKTGTTLRQGGNFGVLVNNGEYNGTTMLKGEFYRFVPNDSSEYENSIDGWVFDTESVLFSNVSGEGADTDKYKDFDLSSLKYCGFVENYEQLVHMTQPDTGSVFLVMEPHRKYEEDYSKNTFFKWRYDGNVIKWWEYDFEQDIFSVVDNYEDLKYLNGVNDEDVCLVKNKSYYKNFHYPMYGFYTFESYGNFSRWVYSKVVGDIIEPDIDCNEGEEPLTGAVVVNYETLCRIKNASYGCACMIKADYDYKEISTEANSFYMFEKSGVNSARWLPVDLTQSPYSLKLSGYRESYEVIENLSGETSSMYFTESETMPLEFYRLDVNESAKFCTDATFSVISYGDSSKKEILDFIDYVSSNYSTYYVTGKPGLKSIFRDTFENRYTNSFSDLPFVEREVIKEPIFSTTKSISAELTPLNIFRYALDKPIENSMGVSVKTFKDESVNHDAAISLVMWNNSSGEFKPDVDDGYSLSGLHLQYNGICTDVYMNGAMLSSDIDENGTVKAYYSSTIYEYPHPCYGELKTAGTGLPIFDGPLNESMEVDDLFFVNGYFVVKNFCVSVEDGKTEEEWKSIDEKIVESGKHPITSSGAYVSGGYVVTNFFSDTGDGSGIPYLYESEMVESSKETPKSKVDSDRFYDYNCLWHIKPSKAIEFYPKSVEGKNWMPYYPLKYVDFIKYHNGYYYISIRDGKEHKEGTVGYDIIETDTLFEERKLVSLERGTIVSGISFFDEHVAVEYEKWTGIDGQLNNTYERYVKWFDCGKSQYKTMPVFYLEQTSSTDSKIRNSNISTSIDYSSNIVALYDNVEVLNSLNRFTPVVNHKSNLFSIRVDDLGFEESEYLTDNQKKILRTYFRNNITEIVNAVKPANTQIFDVYLG